MSTVNHLAREVAAKIVFYGPGLSGKTTSLRKIFESVRPAHRGEMMSLATEGDRTLFFDFLPVKVERVGDCSVRLALYTVPGQVFYNATRKLVLQGADGVVFVADSHPEALERNVESFKNLEENLAEQGIRLERFPLVFQWNKRDLPEVLPVSVLQEKLNARKVPDFETIAHSGVGVLDSLKAITRLVIKDLVSKKVVPAPRPATPVGEAPENRGPTLEAQLQAHLGVRAPGGPPSAAASGRAGASFGAPGSVVAGTAASQTAPVPAGRPSEPPPLAGRLPLGPATALSPAALVDYARAADLAFLSADHPGCVNACQEAVRRALSYAGEGTLEGQAYLLGVDGRDFLRFRALAQKRPLRVDDAAFSLYVLLQVFSRLVQANLPEQESGPQ